MATIGRSFDELDKKIKQTTADIRSADNDVRRFDKSLKLNPGNVDAVRAKYQALGTSLTLNTTKLQQLRQKQRELTTAYQNGNISQAEYEKQLIRINKQIAQSEARVEELTAAMRRQNAEIRNAKFDGIVKGLNSAEAASQKFSRAALVVVGALGAIVKSAITTGDALDDNAKKYSTTAEQLQIQSNRYAKLTADSDTYVRALQSIGSMQSSIAAGRGARYLRYLGQLGIAQDDLAHKTNAEIYDMIFAKLHEVTDATDRATIAQGLFGDAGLNVANVAAATTEELQALDNALIEAGIITSEQAAIAGAAQDKLDSLKYQYQAVAAELLVKALPAFEALVDLFKTTLIPWLSKAADAFGNLGEGGQKALLIGLALVIVLPKLIAGIKGMVTVYKTLHAATLAQTAAQGALNTVSAPWMGIIMAISAALMVLVTIINLFLGKAKDAVDVNEELMGELSNTKDLLADMGYEMTASTENTTRTVNRKEVDVNVKVDATGDTPIDEQNAKNIADAVVVAMDIDAVNAGLGDQNR